MELEGKSNEEGVVIGKADTYRLLTYCVLSGRYDRYLQNAPEIPDELSLRVADICESLSSDDETIPRHQRFEPAQTEIIERYYGLREGGKPKPRHVLERVLKQDGIKLTREEIRQKRHAGLRKIQLAYRERFGNFPDWE